MMDHFNQNKHEYNLYFDVVIKKFFRFTTEDMIPFLNLQISMLVYNYLDNILKNVNLKLKYEKK